MVVNDFYIKRISIQPTEADPELIIHANTVLPFSVSFQGLQTIGGWNPQIV